MADDDFCKHCGAKLRPGTVQCPECGHLTGQVAQASYAQNNQMQFQVQRTSIIDAQINAAFKSVTIMLALYIVVFMISGIFSMFGAQMEVQYLEAYYGSNWTQFLANYGLTTNSEYINMLIISGGITIISTLFALMSLLLVYVRERCMIAVMACTLGSLTLLCQLIFIQTNSVTDIISCALQIIIGLMVARMIYRLKESFKS